MDADNPHDTRNPEWISATHLLPFSVPLTPGHGTREIARAHGGGLVLERSDEHATAFALTLPLGVPNGND